MTTQVLKSMKSMKSFEKYVKEKQLFSSLREHMFNQHPADNHVVQLILAIAKSYLSIHSNHAASCLLKEVRQITYGIFQIRWFYFKDSNFYKALGIIL